MKPKYYYLYIEGGVEPLVIGPFSTPDVRDDAAKARYREGHPDNDAVFGMDIATHGNPHVWEYSDAFMENDG